MRDIFEQGNTRKSDEKKEQNIGRYVKQNEWGNFFFLSLDTRIRMNYFSVILS